MKKIISVIIASMVMSMPVFSLADSAAATTESATPTAGIEAVSNAANDAGTVIIEPAALTEAGIPIFDRTSETTIEQGTVLPFADDNFQLTAPNDWALQELTDEQTAAGYILSANVNDAPAFSVKRVASEAATLDELLPAIAGIEGYTDIQAVLFSGIPYVAYTDAATGAFGYCTLDASNASYLVFEFNADGCTVETAAQLMSSLAITDESADCTIKTLEQLTAPMDDAAKATNADAAAADSANAAVAGSDAAADSADSAAAAEG